MAARGGAGAVVWSVGLAERWSGAVGLARWAGARGGGAAGDAGMGRVVVRLLVALGLVARGGWLAGVKVTERERERENVKVREREKLKMKERETKWVNSKK
uniref:Uncharacterized protein n=1 Tax=Fagus sylvatica TaxID=28930 RepID=A0A2N9HI46_FAGSY